MTSPARSSLLLACLLTSAVAGHASAAPRRQHVSGSVLSPACAEASTRDYQPVTGSFECQALERLSGDWDGTGQVTARGTVDPVTGDARGRFSDTLTLTLASGAKGSVLLTGTLVVDGSSGVETLRGTLSRGTGALRLVRGTVVLTAFSPVTGGPSNGTFDGSLSR